MTFRLLLGYLAACALPQGSCLTVTDFGGMTSLSYCGAEGIDPTWSTSVPNLSKTGLMAECVMARAATDGQSATYTPVNLSAFKSILSYLAGCALPTPQSSCDNPAAAASDPGCLTYTNELGRSMYLPGAVGLAPAWKNGGLTADGQELVSACLMARTNKLGMHVSISLRAPEIPFTLEEAHYYRHHDGAFMGNFFSASPWGKTCDGVDGVWPAGRECTGGSCGFVNLGSCSAVCGTVLQNIGYDNCGPSYSHRNVINTFLYSNIDFSIGNSLMSVACSAGAGACQASGQKVCSADGTGTVCNAVGGAPRAEICGNGVDDNCNDQLDEGFDVGVACTVGVGACASSGVKVCGADGPGTQCSALAKAPGTELCGNGIDDNCDGRIDEGFDVAATCSVGVGAYQASGQKVCTADGSGTQCNAVVGTPRTELCGNVLDDNCDGRIDEALPWASGMAGRPSPRSLRRHCSASSRGPVGCGPACSRPTSRSPLPSRSRPCRRRRASRPPSRRCGCSARSQVAGQTDVAPLGPFGQLSQAMVAGLCQGRVAASLGAGAVVSGAATQACFGLGTLRTGRMLGASPSRQLLAQTIGVVSGSVVAALAYSLLLGSRTLGSAALPAPWAQQWKAFAALSTGGGSGIPELGLPALGAGLILGLCLLIRVRGLRWLPSPVAVGAA